MQAASHLIVDASHVILYEHCVLLISEQKQFSFQFQNSI